MLRVIFQVNSGEMVFTVLADTVNQEITSHLRVVRKAISHLHRVVHMAF